jgi:hypothetical protein
VAHKETVGLDAIGISKLVKTVPSVLGFSAKANLKPKLTWLQERLSLDNKSLSKLAQKQPP